MRRFFLILCSLLFLALMIAQPSMRTGVRNTFVSSMEENGGDEPQLPEIVATNLPDDDTLVGIKPMMPDSLLALANALKSDSLAVDSIGIESIPTDSLAADSLDDEIFEREPIGKDTIDDDREGMTRINREKIDIESAVAFSAKDSVVLIGNNLAYLFGDGKVEYGNFKLDAAEIKMVMDSTTVYATGRIDSVGEMVGKPVFQDGGDSYESKSMSFNFKNQRGFITDIITEQGEGYLTGGRAKKMEDGSFFAEDAIYTTCDEHEHP
ncbi:MAG: hypothetical protein K2K25_02500, partial [Muribaculaceae bacterium]|nr:hypothetical protein [Muribaculaceae bacterium]